MSGFPDGLVRKAGRSRRFNVGSVRSHASRDNHDPLASPVLGALSVTLLLDQGLVMPPGSIGSKKL
jgi:hypothetical protein